MIILVRGFALARGTRGIDDDNNYLETETSPVSGEEACIIHWIRLHFAHFAVILIFTDLKPDRSSYWIM